MCRYASRSSATLARSDSTASRATRPGRCAKFHPRSSPSFANRPNPSSSEDTHAVARIAHVLPYYHIVTLNTTTQVTARTPTSVQMTLRSSPASKEKWPHDFVVVYEVMLGAGNHLKTSMKVANTGVEPMTFTTALHTYFRCTDATAAKVTGLKGASYLDSLNERVRREEANEFVSFNEEVDRIYLSTTDTLAVDDVAGSRSVRITKKNLPDAVVWNPWIEKSKATGDLGDEDYKQFVCVEAAAIERPVVLPAGETWECEQVLESVKLAAPAIGAAPEEVKAEA